MVLWKIYLAEQIILIRCEAEVMPEFNCIKLL